MSEVVELKLKKNEAYNIKIEEIKDMNKSIFLNSYVKAYKTFNILLSEKSRGYSYNNIIAFLGERGSGKTSCMESFINSVEKISEDELKFMEQSELKDQFQEYLKITINNKRIRKINIIEPTFFSKEINILELVISNLFKEFSEKLKSNINDQYEAKKILLAKFQEVYKNMKYMKCSEAYKSSEIEELVQLSTVVSFKENLKELIDEYLKFFEGSKLLISIDDIDLNTEYAHEMTEEIRKYLSIDNVVIIMALKLEQLKAVVKKNYVLENQVLMFSDNNKQLIEEDIENRVEKYLLKLIPIERRIHLKELDEYEYDFEVSIDNIKIDSQDKDFQKIMLKYIYKKTGVLFLPSKYSTNMIIPTNFREFVGFVAILSELKNIDLVELEENKKQIKEQNYLKFKDYFLNSFIKEKLIEEKKMITRLQKSDWRESLQSKEKLGTANYNKGIFLTIKNLKETFPNERRAFVMKTLYSFMLQELYKEFEEDKSNTGYLEIIGKNYTQRSDFNLGKYKKTQFSSENKISKKLSLFLIEEKSANASGGEKEIVFSLFAPYYNSLVKDEIYMQFSDIIIEGCNQNIELDINFRNMELMEKFYIFIESLKIDTTKKISEIVKEIYTEQILEFIKSIEILEEAKKEKMIEQIKNYVDEDLIIELNKLNEVESITQEGVGASMTNNNQ